MTSMEFSLADGVAVLERTPRVLREQLASLPSGWTSGNEGPDTWSPHDVVGPLIHGDRVVWIPRAQIILAQGADRRFTVFDRATETDETTGKSLNELLDQFAQVRADNMKTVASWNLTEQHFALEGEHPQFGTVTLRQLLATWVAHDLGHLVQISRVMAKQYREAIGPWREYLSVMDR